MCVTRFFTITAWTWNKTASWPCLTTRLAIFYIAKMLTAHAQLLSLLSASGSLSVAALLRLAR